MDSNIKMFFVAVAAAIACAAAWAEQIAWVELARRSESSQSECIDLSGTTFELADTDKVVFTTLKSDGSTNVWTQADLVAALGLINRKYHRDCETAAGRKAWHGKLKREIVNTNDLTKTEVYEDGTSFSLPAKIITPSKAVASANKNRLANTNGIPAKLAQARLLRAQEKATTNIVEKIITPGK